MHAQRKHDQRGGQRLEHKQQTLLQSASPKKIERLEGYPIVSTIQLLTLRKPQTDKP